MIKIKAKINFDIVTQMSEGETLDHILDGYEPTEITYDNPDSLKKFIKEALNDKFLNKRACDLYEAKLEKEVKSA